MQPRVRGLLLFFRCTLNPLLLLLALGLQHPILADIEHVLEPVVAVREVFDEGSEGVCCGLGAEAVAAEACMFEVFLVE